MISKRLSLILLKILSASLLILLYYIQRNNHDNIYSLNILLFVLAITDFGYQQTCLMKLIKRKWVIFELSILVILFFIYTKFFSFDEKFLKIIVIGFIISNLTGYVNAINKINIIFFTTLLRFVILYLFFWNSNLALSLVLIFYLFIISFFSLDEKNITSGQYIRKRIEFGVISICAVITEQLIRLDNTLNYNESIMVLLVGYIVGLSSIIQQSVTQIHFARKDKTQIESVDFDYLKLFYVLLSVMLFIYFSYLFLAVNNLYFLLLCMSILISNLLFRYALTIDNLNNKSLLKYTFISLLCLINVLILNEIKYSLINIQIFTSIILIFFSLIIILRSKKNV